MSSNSTPEHTKPEPAATLYIVSGLPRSGTSMMMSMLEAGGMEILTDSIRSPDQDNPRGYYEYERVKALTSGDFEWIPAANGKAVKIIAALIPHLPDVYRYRVIFMRRSMPEILASQRKMLANRGEDPNRMSDELLTTIYDKHIKMVSEWMDRQAHLEWIEVKYNELLSNPELYLGSINKLMGSCLDIVRMKNAIDPKLYRQRRPGA